MHCDITKDYSLVLIGAYVNGLLRITYRVSNNGSSALSVIVLSFTIRL